MDVKIFFLINACQGMPPIRGLLSADNFSILGKDHVHFRREKEPACREHKSCLKNPS